MATVKQYSEMLDELDREEDPSLSLELASPSPDLSSRATKLTEETGFPVPAIPGVVNEAEVKQAKAIDREALADAPKTAQFLRPQENADVSSDDVANLTGLEWILSAAPKAFEKGQATDELGQIGFQSMWTAGDRMGMDEPTRKRATDLGAIIQADLGDEGFFASVLTEGLTITGQVLAPMERTLPKATAAGMAAGTTAAILGQLGPQAAVPEELATVPIATAAGFGSMMASGLITNAFKIEGGHAYLEYMQLKDLDGAQSMDRDVARGAALVVGSLNAVLEGVGTKMVLRGTGVSKLMEAAGRKQVGQLLAKPLVRDAFKRAGVAWARTWGGEVGTELVQEVVTAVTGEVAKAAATGDFADMTQEEFVTRMAEILEKVGKGMIIPAGAGVTVSFAQDVYKARKAQQNQEVFEALGEVAAESKLNERLPARFQEFVDHVTEDGPVEAVYIEAEKFNEYFQSQNIEMADVADVLPSVADQVESFATGGDVRIPIGEYASKIAPSEHHAGLIRHLRFRPDDMSLAQAELFEKNFGQQFREDVEAEVARVEALAESERPTDIIYQEVTQQLVQAGRDPEVAKREALVWRAFFKTMGERTGLDPMETYRSLQLRVQQRELTELGPGELAQSAFHGSPHRFDKFDINKIGTGEGAQAYGHGLYFAESPGVAETYRMAGGWQPGAEYTVKIGKAPYTAKNVREKVIIDAFINGDEDAIKRLSSQYERSLQGRTAQVRGESAEALGLIKRIRKEGAEPVLQGTLYEVDIPDDQIAKMLDWDKPLSEQAPEIQNMLRKDWPLDADFQTWADEGMTGGDLYKMTSVRRGHIKTGTYTSHDSEVSEWMNRNGIPGIKYLDQGSRDAGKGTRNLVLFSDENIKILKRDGKAVTPKEEGQAQELFQQQELPQEVRVPLEDGLELVIEPPSGMPLTPRQKAVEQRFIEQVVADPEGMIARYEALPNTAGGRILNTDEARLLSDDYAASPEAKSEFSPAVHEAASALIKVMFARRLAQAHKADELNRVRFTAGGSGAGKTKAIETIDAAEDASVGIAIKPQFVYDTNMNKFDSAEKKIQDTLAAGKDVDIMYVVRDPVEALVAGTLTGAMNPKSGRYGRTVSLFEHERTHSGSLEVAKMMREKYKDDPRVRFTVVDNQRGKNKAVVAEKDILSDLDYTNLAPKLREALDHEYETNHISEAVYRGTLGGDAAGPGVPGGEGLLGAPGQGAAQRAEEAGVSRPGGGPLGQVAGGGTQPQRVGLAQEARGSVQLPIGGLGTGQTVINLFESANLSTSPPDSGHVFLEMFGQFALTENASEQVRADWAATLQYLDAKPGEAFSVEQQEKWAKSFEAYVREGVAPSPELESAFARFQAWLLRIYKDVKASLGVEINDEIRGVFDRLLASDEEIEAVRAYMNMKPLFTEAERSGMSATEQQQYLNLVAEDAQEAKQRLQTRVVKELARAEKEWWKTESKRVAEEVTADINSRPIYQAVHFLQTGESLVGELPAEIEPVKLNKAALVSRYGEGVLANLPRRVVAEEGVHPDEIAEIFGIASGDELVIPMQSLVPRVRAIAAETSRIMNERHGDMMRDGTLTEAALDEAHKGDKHLRVLEREMTVLSRRAGQPPTPRQVAKRLAAEILSSKRVIDAQRSSSYLQAERKFARATEKALMKGDALAAVQAKRQQLINHHLYVESRRIAAEVEKGLSLAKLLGKKGVRKAIAPDYLEQIDGLLQDYDFTKGTSLRAQERREALAAFVARKTAENESVTVPDEVIQDAGRKTYKVLTVDEFRAVTDSIRNLRHLGRLKNKLLLDLQKRELEEAVTDAVDSIESHSPGLRAKVIEPRQPKEEAKMGIADWFAAHRKMSSLVRMFDGFKDDGVIWNLFIRPMNARGDWEASRFAESTEQLWGIFKEHLGEQFKLLAGMKAEVQARTFGLAPGKPPLMQKTYIPEINQSLTREAMISIGLNWGNETNQRRLAAGYSWEPTQVQAVLNHLTKSEWDFIQGVWDYYDTFWEEVAAKEKRVTGVAPERVVPVPVQTRYGEYRGGYHPVSYDDRQSPRAYADLAKETAENAMRGNYVRATTRRSHTKGRVKGEVVRPVRLDFGVIFEHVHQVVHDLAWHEWLIDANKLVGHKRFQTAVIENYGKPVYDQLKTGIEAIATGDVASQTAFERAINHLRKGVSVAGMGWSIWTSLLQPTGLFQGMTRVGPKYMGRAFGEWLGDAARMENTLARIHEKSPFMQNRVRTQMREINEIQNKIRRAGPMTAMMDSYFYLITRAQLVADIPIWLGSYHKSLDAGMDEATAVAVADQSVLDTQSGGQVKDLAAIQRGSPLMKLWTNFYSYFSATYNLSAEAHGRLKMRGYSNPAALGRFAVDYLVIYALPAAITGAMYELLRGSGDDPDDLLEAILREQISYLTGTMVGLRELGGVASGFYGYEGPAGTRFFSELSNLAQQIQQGEADAALWKSANQTAGILFWYPAAQIQRTAQGMNALIEGETSNPLALVMGPRK